MEKDVVGVNQLSQLNQIPYKRPNYFDDFHIAGYSYYDGYMIETELSPGTEVLLVKEAGNPYDEDAVVIYYGEYKLGYVPRKHNRVIAQLLYFGHGDVFVARIKENNTEGSMEYRYRVRVDIVNKVEKV